MDRCFSKLTICFENPFWVGICERESEGRYSVCKITFGAEPKDNEVYEFFLKNYMHLKFSKSIADKICEKQKINPKRLQRSIRSELKKGIGTTAHQALKIQQQQLKQERKVTSKKKSKLEAEYRFKLQKEKRKAKHRGH